LRGESWWIAWLFLGTKNMSLYLNFYVEKYGREKRIVPLRGKRQPQRQVQQQIPFGDDNKKDKSEGEGQGQRQKVKTK
jgi:hypothetical protein